MVIILILNLFFIITLIIVILITLIVIIFIFIIILNFYYLFNTNLDCASRLLLTIKFKTIGKTIYKTSSVLKIL